MLYDGISPQTKAAPGAVRLTDREQIATYLEMLFGYVDFQDGDEIRLRGLGEKGTDREGEFREVISIDPSITRNLPSVIEWHAARWNSYRIGAFIIPGVAHGGDKEENVRLFTTLVVDLDTGDTAAKLKHIEHNIGPASMVVHSGGLTDTGQPKTHAYWRLNEPTADVKRVAELRDLMAEKVGDDPSFKRVTQVIRIPGTTHGKNGHQTACRIADIKHIDYSLFELADLINSMHYMPGVVAKRPPMANAGGSLNFAQPETSTSAEKTTEALTSTVHAGGVDGTTRWDSFSTVAGHHLHCARRGDYDIGHARELTRGWMLANMVPPWPDQRFDKEWRGLLDHDVTAYGTMPPARVMPPNLQAETLSDQNPLREEAAHHWARGEKPKRKFLVEGLIPAGKHVLFVADSGIGKTLLGLDLGLKVASIKEGEDLRWCGQKIKPDARGPVVILTTEDDREELHIRLADIDPNYDRIREAGDDFMIYPTIHRGGAFPLVEYDRQRTAGPSRRWQEFVQWLRAIPNLKLVVIDTLNSVLHGDENSATTINEFIRAATNVVCGELGATLVVTHHVRKSNGEVVRNSDEMLQSIRGSSALVAAFRAVLGIWPATDFDRRLEAMGEEPRKGRLYMLAVLKRNNPEMLDGTKTLLRSAKGLLIDVTERDKYQALHSDELGSWLLYSIKHAAKAGHPFTDQSRSASNGLYKRREHLAPLLQHLGHVELPRLLRALLDRGVVVHCAVGGGIGQQWVDVPDGPFATAREGLRPDKGSYTPPDWNRLYYEKWSGRVEHRKLDD